MSWYSVDREASLQKEQELLDRLNSDKIFRFRIKPGETATITFLDTPKPTFYFAEHVVKSGNHFEFVTCVGETAACPLCAQGEVPSMALAGTIINHSDYTTKKGNVIKNRKQLIVLKGKAKRAFEKQIDKLKGNLAFAVFEADRDISPTSCATGETFEYKGRFSKEKFAKIVPEGMTLEEFVAPMDYETILAPKAMPTSNLVTKEVTGRSIGSSPDEDPMSDLGEPEPPDTEEASSLDDLV